MHDESVFPAYLPPVPYLYKTLDSPTNQDLYRDRQVQTSAVKMSAFATIPGDLERAPPRRRRAQPRQCPENKSYKPQSGRNPKPGFAYFPRLPLEIRIMIW
jgi:hypothetical protein